MGSADVSASHHPPPTSPLFWVCCALKLYFGQSGSTCKLTSTFLACGKLVLLCLLMATHHCSPENGHLLGQALEQSEHESRASVPPSTDEGSSFVPSI